MIDWSEGTAATQEADLAMALGRIVETTDHGRLPTERELARRLGVSRHAVRRALAALEARGLLWRHVGRGTFAGVRPEAPPLPAALLRHGTPREVVEARQMLEPPIAAAAALRGSHAAIRRIGEIGQRCAAAANIEDYEVWDEAFHRAVVAAADNVLLTAVFETVNGARKAIVWGLIRHAAPMQERRPLFAEQHARIAAAITARDAEGAWAAMRAHTDTMAEIYASLVPAGPDGRAAGRGGYR